MRSRRFISKSRRLKAFISSTRFSGGAAMIFAISASMSLSAAKSQSVDKTTEMKILPSFIGRTFRTIMQL
jgi:hypothetical protein